MLRLFRSKAFHRNWNKISVRKLSNETDQTHNNAFEPDVNFVKLIGTVYNDSWEMLCGNHLCKVSQACENDDGQSFAIIHSLHIPKKMLTSMGINGFKKGQLINVNGYVRSNPFTTIDNQLKYVISIMPHTIELQQEKDRLFDVCIVMMTASIESPIWDHKSSTMFSIRTNVPIRNEENKFTGKYNSFSQLVTVFEPDVRLYIRANINRYDTIFIEGYLNYNTCKIADGKLKTCGTIVAVHAEKVEDITIEFNSFKS